MNKDGTIYPTGAPFTILGFQNDELILVSKEEKVYQLIFSEIKPALMESKKVFDLKGFICGRSSKMNDAQIIRVDNNGKSIAVVLDEQNYLHKAK